MDYDDSVAESIENYTLDLRLATRYEDRHLACQNLKALARNHRVQVGAHSMDSILEAIKTNRQDTELVNYGLETINHIINGPDSGSPAATWTPQTSHLLNGDPGIELSEIFLKKVDNVAVILDTIDNGDFNTRWVSIKILYGLAMRKLEIIQWSILSFPLGIGKLFDIVSDEQEVLRNDALSLFVKLTSRNRDIQSMVVYEECFRKLMNIIQMENYLNGTCCVVNDCLNIIYNILRDDDQSLHDEKNKEHFRDGCNIEKLVPFFDQDWNAIMWTDLNTTCLVIVLKIIDSLVNTTNSPENITASQIVTMKCGLLDKLCALLTASVLPIGVVKGVMNTASDIIRGHIEPNANKVMPTNAMVPIMMLAMVKEWSASSARSAAAGPAGTGAPGSGSWICNALI